MDCNEIRVADPRCILCPQTTDFRCWRQHNHTFQHRVHSVHKKR